MLLPLIKWALFAWTAYCVHRFGIVAAASWGFGRGLPPDPDAVFGLALFAYTLPVLAIIAAHEAGHRFMARRLGVASSGPYFLPLHISWVAASGIPIPPFGTIGAFTRVAGCEPVKRWQIALAGPVAGFVVAASCVAVGMALSVPGRGPSAYQPSLLASLTAGLTWHPVLFAGWFGVLLTAFNLLPLPGLDGWHILTAYEHLGAAEKWITAGVALWLAACLA